MNGYKKEFMGKLPTGEEIYSHTVSNGQISISVLDYGATLHRFVHNGTDIVCGYDTLEGYLNGSGCVGGTIGRYANRITDGRINIDGLDIYLDKNNKGIAHLHGGAEGFHKKYWYVEDGLTHEGWPCICCGLISYAGESGYPGRMHISVNYILKNRSLIIDYRAETTATTVCNMTNHSYFNLHGYDKPGIADHKLRIFADKYTEVYPDTLLVTGNRPFVDGTAFDFRVEKTIGEDMDKTGLAYPGYDHNFILDRKKQEVFEGVKLNLAAVCKVPERKMTVLTSKPCMQVYTGNFLGNGPDFKGGVKQQQHHAVCFETQFEPNDPADPNGKSYLTPDKKYRHITVYRID